MKKEPLVAVATVNRTEVIKIDLSALDKKRALCAVRSIIGQYMLDTIILEDALKTEHDPHVYYIGPSNVFSHEFANGILTIYEETFELS